MLSKLAYAMLYSLFGSLTYGLFLYMTFPSEAVRDRIVYEANQAGVKMQVLDVKPAFPTGLTLEGIDLYAIGKDKKAAARRRAQAARRRARAHGADSTGDEGLPTPSPTPAPKAPMPVLTVDELTIASLLPLVTPKGTARSPLEFDMRLYQGSAEGAYSTNDLQTHVRFDLKDVNLASVPMEGDSFSIRAEGNLGFTMDLTLDNERIRNSSGQMDLHLDRLVIRKETVIRGMNLPVELPFKVSGGHFDVKNGRATLDELKLVSDPLEVVVTGHIALNSKLSRSRLNLKVAFKFGDALAIGRNFADKDTLTDDDFFHYSLTGLIDNPRWRPDRAAARAKRRRNASTGKPRRERAHGPDRGAGGPGSPGRSRYKPMNIPGIRSPIMDEEERARIREERRRRAEERRRRREEMRRRRLLNEESGGPGRIPRLRPPVPLSREDDDVDFDEREPVGIIRPEMPGDLEEGEEPEAIDSEQEPEVWEGDEVGGE